MEHRLQPVDKDRLKPVLHHFLRRIEECGFAGSPRYARRMWQGGSAYRRFLPHYQNREQTYFITFCSRDRRILNPKARYLVLKQIVRGHQVSYDLQTAVVMPDHVHLLLTPNAIRLSEIMRRIKGASAREVNRLSNRTGPVWQREYFDRQLRGTENAPAKGEYIVLNPVRAGLVSTADEYPWVWRAWIEGGYEWR